MLDFQITRRSEGQWEEEEGKTQKRKKKEKEGEHIRTTPRYRRTLPSSGVSIN